MLGKGGAFPTHTRAFVVACPVVTAWCALPVELYYLLTHLLTTTHLRSRGVPLAKRRWVARHHRLRAVRQAEALHCRLHAWAFTPIARMTSTNCALPTSQELLGPSRASMCFTFITAPSTASSSGRCCRLGRRLLSVALSGGGVWRRQSDCRPSTAASITAAAGACAAHSAGRDGTWRTLAAQRARSFGSRWPQAMVHWRAGLRVVSASR